MAYGRKETFFFGGGIKVELGGWQESIHRNVLRSQAGGWRAQKESLIPYCRGMLAR